MRVWITGASSGIGEACALRWAAKGASLVLTSSSRDKLDVVASKCRAAASVAGAGSCDTVPGVCVLPYDFAGLEGVESLCSDAWQAFGGLDVVFLNAGISQRTSVEDTSMEMVRKIMEIDYFAPVAIAKAVLPRFLAAGGGHIAVTSSIAGRFGFPLRCGYSSAKHALYGFFESLAAECSGRGIKVTIVCPGRVRTGISLRALDKGGAAYGKMDPGQASGLDAGKAARKIVGAIEKGRREVLVGRKELLMVYIKRFFPGLCARISRRIKPV